MFNYATGGTGFYVKSMLKSKHPYTAVSLCLVYQLVVTMILMSLLTGVMTNALTKASGDLGRRYQEVPSEEIPLGEIPLEEIPSEKVLWGF